MAAVTQRWTGAGVAPGTAVAGWWRIDRPIPGRVDTIDPDEVEAAFQDVAADLTRVADRVRAQGRSTAADIVAVGALIASDIDLVESARDAASADDPLAAIHDAVEVYAALLEALPDETLRERAADVRQIGRRVIERLLRAGTGISGLPTADRFVLVADEIGPADLIEHLGGGIVGAAAVRGGANSHAAIVARSIGLPVVMGVDPQLLDLPDNTTLLVDANSGVVMADPADTEIARAEEAAVRGDERRRLLAAERGLPHVTADGEPFLLLCNVASDVEVRVGRDSGAVGIGLLRTELPFLETPRWPSEADHRRSLRPIFAEAAGWPVTVRLLDFANDKIPPFLAGSPAGLRALLDNPDALTAQLRAVVDLGRTVQLRIMVPMVSTVEELQAVRAMVDTVVADLGVPPVLVGAMVETVAAVESMAQLCEIADFFSIGTNDLTSEVLDLDRLDPQARPELTAHPYVLELISRVVAAARRAGRPISVCGDAGGHPTTLPLMVGAGVRAVSVACARIDETRYRLRRLDTAACQRVFAEALGTRDAAAAAELVRRQIEVVVP